MSLFGNKGKLTERLKNIVKMRNCKAKDTKQNVKDSKDIYQNFLKVVSAIPLLVYENILEDSDNSTVKASNRITIDSELLAKDSLNNIDSKKARKELVSNIDVSLLKKQQDKYFNSINIKVNNKNKEINNNNSKNKKTEKKIETNNVDKTNELHLLEKKIINLIKKDLIKRVNEYEILQSELYLISNVCGDEKKVLECRQTLDEIKKMLCKIDKLKQKYDYLRDNYDFEYMLETDDFSLLDNIILLKNNFSNNIVRGTVADYKLLDLYKYLYLRIDKLQDETIAYSEYEKAKKEELKARDIEFQKIKENVYNVDKTNKNYIRFVEEENNYLSNLEEKLLKIDSREVCSYKLKGFNKFLLTSFKYIGLLMLNPLKGIVPSIAMETLLTKNVVANLYNNLVWDETRRMVYETIDYSSDISNAIYDLDYANRLVDGTLEDIVNLKIKYNEDFKKYQGDFLEYTQVINKINDMENKILGNKIKIEMMQKKYREFEEANYKKLKLVNQLNKEETNK